MKANTLTLQGCLGALAKKEISHDELYRETHDAIAALNTKLNIYLAIDHEALAKANQQTKSTLRGVPVAVKDNFLTVGLETTASSRVLKGFMPTYESTVTKKIKSHGVVVIGKTNMDAGAHGSSTETSDFGPTKNPRNPEHLPGGSSGGSAAAVAADLCVAAIGSETAGSVRQPASWCGVVGLKPTYGRVSRYGVIAMGSSLDCPGPITKTVYDGALLLNVMAGADPWDATTGPKPVPDFTKNIDQGVRGMKIGILYIDHPKLRGGVVSAAMTKAGKVFEELGAHVSLVPLSDKLEAGKALNPDFAIGVYTVVQRSEVSSNLARYDGIRYGNDRSFFATEAKRRMMLGAFTLSKGYADKYYVRAQQVRSLYIQNNGELLSRFDVLLAPTSPGFAQKLGATADNPMFGELEDMLLESSTVSGLPGISVPCFRDPVTNLYLGLNIVAKQWDELTMLRAAYAYEKATEWNSWRKV